ncbi:MAG: hypothetical protein JO165_06780 [Candidatus Eremiobacteraeota bacterium]|nr:hypothetical protein [Candidatus Eremiobacteraeota bacterium]
MALTLETTTPDVLSLDEFVNYVERNVDVEDFHQLCELAPMWSALLNNRGLISNVVARELQRWRDFQDGNSYVGTTLILARSRKFFIRANMWVPIGSDNGTYGVTHDHNFSFLTGGYAGNGYTTEIYRLEDGYAAKQPGQRVRLEFQERTTLPRGKIMVYHAAQDVHRQNRPNDFSISINLMVPKEIRERPQFYYDLDRSTVTGCSFSEEGRTLALFKLAQFVADEQTKMLLFDITETSSNQHVRAAAKSALDSILEAHSP